MDHSNTWFWQRRWASDFALQVKWLTKSNAPDSGSHINGPLMMMMSSCGLETLTCHQLLLEIWGDYVFAQCLLVTSLVASSKMDDSFLQDQAVDVWRYLWGAAAVPPCGCDPVDCQQWSYAWRCFYNLWHGVTLSHPLWVWPMVCGMIAMRKFLAYSYCVSWCFCGRRFLLGSLNLFYVHN